MLILAKKSKQDKTNNAFHVRKFFLSMPDFKMKIKK